MIIIAFVFFQLMFVGQSVTVNVVKTRKWFFMCKCAVKKLLSHWLRWKKLRLVSTQRNAHATYAMQRKGKKRIVPDNANNAAQK